MKYSNIREEELKNKIAQDYFGEFDCSKIIGNIDFCVTLSERESLFWAEAKKGKADIYKSIVQLILTIGKARTFDKSLPPAFIGAFDAESMAFIDYSDIHDVFYENDFNWNVTPSNHESKEFALVLEKVTKTIESNSLLFHFDKDDNEIKIFIKDNFIVDKSKTSKIKIDKNNFMVIYNKWLSVVKPTIAVKWDVVKKSGLIDGDFYLADLLSKDNESLKENLYVLLKKNQYEIDRKITDSGMFSYQSTSFIDKQKAHIEFWNKYERPPKAQYWDYIVKRRDLLVPQDIRERKGSFFTPQIWVELSQKYLTDILGENWQDEYYIWDCAAGTGNLLTGLTNKYNIWASTLDQQDIDVMKDRINNGANLLESHIFQFDFLNDDFTKLPEQLRVIINDEEKRKKLVVYINPPYAEATNSSTITGTGENKKGVSTQHNTSEYFNERIGNASNEIFALFMAQVFDKIPNCYLAQFSKLKFIQGSNFIKFKEFFKAQFLNGFIVPSNTFDNVKGNFPIGFTIWNLNITDKIKKIRCDIINQKNERIGKKVFYGNLPKSINKWIKKFENSEHETIGLMVSAAPDFQHNKQLAILSKQQERYCFEINQNNIFPFSVYFAVRHCIESSWLNDRDQFLYPNNKWKTDTEFQNDCLTYTLFNNTIQSEHNENNANYWIPFTEQEINAKEKFVSNFMTNFIKGKLKQEEQSKLFNSQDGRNTPLKFSDIATEVFDTGKKLWKYYHEQPDCKVNASLYDIREYFQGRSDNGKMNNKSADEQYMELITDLRNKIKALAKKIEPKVYTYEFLRH